MNKKNINIKMSVKRFYRDALLTGMHKKVFSFVLGFTIIFSAPLLIMAARLVPDCNVVVNGAMTKPCNFEYLMIMINGLITFVLFTLATPLFALILIYTGWLYLSAGGSSENVSKAKKIFKNALIGYVIALAAWLVVKTILTTLGFTGTTYLTNY